MTKRPTPAGRPSGEDSPPEPVLRIGITGHRLDKLPDRAVEALRARLHEAFASLDAALRRRIGTDRETPRCRLVTALAEGADRLAADAAPHDWPLTALLPMPLALYREDFLPPGQQTSASAEAFDAYLARAQSVTELPLLAAELTDERRPAQYAALGRALVRQIDCLVAVWDGEPARGPGGTATVVAEATSLGLPVLWLDPSGLAPARLIERLPDDAPPETAAADETSLDRIAGRAQPPEKMPLRRPGRPS